METEGIAERVIPLRYASTLAYRQIIIRHLGTFNRTEREDEWQDVE